jgi:hypothetical protein
MFLEILSVRVGYYQESQDDYDSPAMNANELSEFTYGLGLQIPLDKLTKIPLKINFDYASLPQPSFTKSQPSFENFSTYTLRVNYLLKK